MGRLSTIHCKSTVHHTSYLTGQLPSAYATDHSNALLVSLFSRQKCLGCQQGRLFFVYKGRNLCEYVLLSMNAASPFIDGQTSVPCARFRRTQHTPTSGRGKPIPCMRDSSFGILTSLRRVVVVVCLASDGCRGGVSSSSSSLSLPSFLLPRPPFKRPLRSLCFFHVYLGRGHGTDPAITTIPEFPRPPTQPA